MRPYSQDLRERVMAACQEGQLAHETIAKLYKVSSRWIRKLLARQRDTGSCAARPARGGAPPKLTAQHEQRLIQAIQSQPDATLERLRQACGNPPVSLAAICKRLKKLRLGRKKKTLHAAEQQREDVRQEREAWQREMPQLEPEKLVFIDECGTQTDLTPRYGRAPVGQRVVEAVPTAGWTINTLVGALRLEGQLAPMVLEGPLDGAGFLAWGKHFLLPLLRPGDIVIWDNLRAHQASGLKAAIDTAGALLKPLPPYSPDFNPIEKMWSKVKESLRRAKARSARALRRAIKGALASVTPEDAAAWFESCGYRNTVS